MKASTPSKHNPLLAPAWTSITHSSSQIASWDVMPFLHVGTGWTNMPEGLHFVPGKDGPALTPMGYVR